MKKTPPSRRTFTVREQLVGKLGPRGYGRLLDQLAAQAKGPSKRRRRPRRKAAV